MYLINHPEFGWQAFGGNVTTTGGRVTVAVTDSMRQRLFIAPLGLYLTLDAGRFESVSLDPQTGQVGVALAPATATVAQARLRVERTARTMPARTWTPAGTFALERGAYTIPLGTNRTTVELR